LTGQPITSLQTQWESEQPRHACRFIGLRRDLEDQNRRTNERVRRMIAAGLVEEVRGLLRLERPLSGTARQALGYAEVIEHLERGTPLDEVAEKIKINTRQFAKAQRTWFKRFVKTKWLDLTPQTKVEALAEGLERTFDAG